MRHLFILTPLLLALFAGTAQSQSASGTEWLQGGLNAFQRGDHATAASLLRAYLFKASKDADPWADYTLGLMYFDGLGVDQDIVRGCALIRVAEFTFRGRIDHESERLMASALFNRNCSGLGDDEMFWMNRMMGCFWEGPPNAVFDLGHPLGSITVERLKVRLFSGPEPSIHDLPGGACGEIVLPLVHTRLEIPGKSGSTGLTRDFLEYLSWRTTGERGKKMLELHWMVFEIRPGRVNQVLSEAVYQTNDLTLPIMKAPPSLRSVTTLTSGPTGDVEWAIDGSPGRSGSLPQAPSN